MVGARNLAESGHTALCLKLQTVRGLKKWVCLHFFWQLVAGVEIDRHRWKESGSEPTL